MENNWILAQQGGVTEQPVGTKQEQTSTKAPGEPNIPADKPSGGSGMGSFLPLLIWVAVFVMLYMVLSRGPKKREQKQMQMVKSLKKNDKICTTSGIIATVIEVKPDEITIKIDEANNTKMRIIPAAVLRNLSEEKPKI